MKKVVTLTGPSGSGKGYVMDGVRNFLGAEELPFYTTRGPRSSENGSRIFVSDEEFDRLATAGKLWLCTEAFGFRYGAGVDDTRMLLSGESPMVAEVYVDNVQPFRERMLDANMIALVPTSMDIIRMRLMRRNESREQIAARVSAAEAEIARIEEMQQCFNLVYHFNEAAEKDVLPDIKKYLREYYALFDRARRAHRVG